jgi:hypothetical protein
MVYVSLNSGSLGPDPWLQETQRGAFNPKNGSDSA